MPEGTDPALACVYFSPVGTAWATVHPIAQVRPGERVLVTGASGAVGAMAVRSYGGPGCRRSGTGSPHSFPPVRPCAAAGS
ncbi:hypothetical protein SAM23877_6005 [Streptomyces ambofaciens ATCC 23877]|uniref:Uncharacterized protein n=1 Tax=Streptomyces ambofaciens (strain ATCC 23877 / 3486 / DSM 40053 / JCM 4204 / NBRC 12836 / NRRL B-2516) TaxID=278992 RepID=A0A0K2B118_STRA7|nr:hypothetical protein SAM23877_6005 [Streptomyces ambofaciens ATCC 23877]